MKNPRTLWRLVIYRSSTYEEVRYIETSSSLEEAVETAKDLAGADGYSLTEYCQVERSA